MTRQLIDKLSTSLRTVLFCLALGLCLPPGVAAQGNGGDADAPDPLDKLRDAMVETGVGRDYIPALFNPSYTSVSDASLSMEPNEMVFVATFFPGQPRIYPQRIMVWHEVVNDSISDDEPVSITYCPLTGSVAAYRTKMGNTKLAFGVSGQLLNSNTVIYDYFSASNWSQITGQCFDGMFKGRLLQRLPMTWTTWGRASKLWPDAQVLSRSTGFRRSYGRDPYGSYVHANSYYEDLAVMYPLMNVDKRLHPKQRILGIEIDGLYAVVDKQAVAAKGVDNFAVGVTPLVAIWDPALDAVRIYMRNMGDRILTFDWADGYAVDLDTHSEWNGVGECTNGHYLGTRLQQIIAVDSMWFAWSAFYPRSFIFPGDEFQTLPPVSGGSLPMF